jgi:hypothetical protein
MNTSRNRVAARLRVRPLLSLFFFVVATIAVVGVISSSHAIDRSGLASLKDDAQAAVDILAAAGATPTPPACKPCWQATTETENFDSVSPPALPMGWIATNAQGPPPLWVTSDSGVPMPPADSPPNAAFIDDPAVVSDKRLDSVNVGVFEGFISWVTFRHNFNLEASPDDPNLGFDGGVLEFSTDGGNTFQYVPPEAFIMGGYNRTISTDRGSPIAGLQAWSGNSEGFITSVVALNRGDMDVRLRWRMATDTTGAGEGWRVDSINVFGCHGPPCTVTPTPPMTATPTATATATATPSVTVTPTPSEPPPPTPWPRPTPAPRPIPHETPTPHATPAFTPHPRPSP